VPGSKLLCKKTLFRTQMLCIQEQAVWHSSESSRCRKVGRTSDGDESAASPRQRQIMEDLRGGPALRSVSPAAAQQGSCRLQQVIQLPCSSAQEPGMNTTRQG
jgi:hypothetical protein